MDARSFDFARFQDYRAEREERVRGFLAGAPTAPNVLLIERAHCDYVKCRTQEESLEVQLDGITRQMDLGTDYVPFLEPWFGVGVYANAFGAEYVWVEGESAQTRYVAHNAAQAAALQPRAVEDTPAMKLVLDAIDYFVDQTRGRIPIACTDTQSPFDTATLLWETSDFFTSVYTDPQIVHALLGRITDLIERFTRLQMEHTGQSLARPGHIMLSTVRGPGLSISDDNIVMVGPELYEVVAVPYNSRLSRAFGGLAVHSCGNFERQLPALLRTEGLAYVDGAFTPEGDPNPNTDFELFRDRLKGTGVILQARMGHDWQAVLKRLHHPELRLVAILPESGVAGQAREEVFNRALGECV